MARKTLALAALVALCGLPALMGCGHSDPTETAAPPPSSNAPPPINAGATKPHPGAMGLQGGGMATPNNPNMGKPMAKPPGM